jgi:hypothetical protein
MDQPDVAQTIQQALDTLAAHNEALGLAMSKYAISTKVRVMKVWCQIHVHESTRNTARGGPMSDARLLRRLYTKSKEDNSEIYRFLDFDTFSKKSKNEKAGPLLENIREFMSDVQPPLETSPTSVWFSSTTALWFEHSEKETDKPTREELMAVLTQGSFRSDIDIDKEDCEFLGLTTEDIAVLFP